MNDRWLIVYNNYDNPLMGNQTEKILASASWVEASISSDDDKDSAMTFDLRKYLPETDHGAILVTTRSSMVKLGQTIHLRKLEDINESLEILASVSGHEDLRQGEYQCCRTCGPMSSTNFKQTPRPPTLQGSSMDFLWPSLQLAHIWNRCQSATPSTSSCTETHGRNYTKRRHSCRHTIKRCTQHGISRTDTFSSRVHLRLCFSDNGPISPTKTCGMSC